jgi:cyclopropane-fatty-acyl-phospholipid synthase
MPNGSGPLTSAERAAAQALLERLPAPLSFAFPGGELLEPENRSPCTRIVFRNALSIAKVLTAPSLLTLGEAFVTGDIDIEGDLIAALEAAYAADTLVGVASSALAERPPEADAVRHHYDLPPEFYALFLDRRLVYSCAYYRRGTDTLDEAQAAKLDLICRKLDLGAGERFLDLGCGWGGLTAWAADRHQVDALGVTLSEPQASWGADMIRRAGLENRARIHYGTYRDLEGESCFDKVAAVGLIEHVGVAHYETYFRQMFRLLRPGGLFLSHGITHPMPGEHSTGMAFLTTHVFPGAEFQRVGYTVARMEDAGFRIADVEALGGHYALTTATWLARLQANSQAARRLVGERVYRTWVVYLAAATVAFRHGWIDLHQVLAYRPGGAIVSAGTRDRWYRLR